MAVADQLHGGMFYRAANGFVYQAVLACYQRGTPPDFVTIADELKRQNRLDSIGGISALVEYEAPLGGYHVGYYADIVRQAAMRRAAADAAGKIARLAYDEAGDLETQIADMHSELTRATVGSSPTALVAVGDALNAYYTAIADTGEDRDGAPTKTGFRDVDQLLGGFWPSDLVILAGRPGMGKTSLMMSLIDGICGLGQSVLTFSLEMSRVQLLNRMISMHTGIDSHRLRTRAVGKNELTRIADAINTLHQYPLWIDDTAGRTVQQIRSQAQRYVAQHGPLGLLAIDYLGLMESGGRYAGQRVNEVSEISRGLKQLARELNCPVLALHQLSRAVEGRTSHVPMLSDLRDSGAVEQDADIVLFIYREEMYERETDKKGVAEIHVAKHRNGPLGVIPMRFEADTTRFMDLAPAFRTPEGY